MPVSLGSGAVRYFAVAAGAVIVSAIGVAGWTTMRPAERADFAKVVAAPAQARGIKVDRLVPSRCDEVGRTSPGPPKHRDASLLTNASFGTRIYSDRIIWDERRRSSLPHRIGWGPADPPSWHRHFARIPHYLFLHEPRRRRPRHPTRMGPVRQPAAALLCRVRLNALPRCAGRSRCRPLGGRRPATRHGL